VFPHIEVEVLGVRVTIVNMPWTPKFISNPEMRGLYLEGFVNGYFRFSPLSTMDVDCMRSRDPARLEERRAYRLGLANGREQAPPRSPLEDHPDFLKWDRRKTAEFAELLSAMKKLP
jgi:hypothetical protein